VKRVGQQHPFDVSAAATTFVARECDPLKPLIFTFITKYRQEFWSRTDLPRAHRHRYADRPAHLSGPSRLAAVEAVYEVMWSSPRFTGAPRIPAWWRASRICLAR
jgi:hypothetical protein